MTTGLWACCLVLPSPKCIKQKQEELASPNHQLPNTHLCISSRTPTPQSGSLSLDAWWHLRNGDIVTTTVHIGKPNIFFVEREEDQTHFLHRTYTFFIIRIPEKYCIDDHWATSMSISLANSRCIKQKKTEITSPKHQRSNASFTPTPKSGSFIVDDDV